MSRSGLALIILCVSTLSLRAQNYYGDIGDFKILKPSDKVDVKSVPAPKGAKVLFDGTGFDKWKALRGAKVRWQLVKLKGGGTAMEVARRTGGIVTKDKFGGKFKLHVEFRVPYMPKARGQGRGNSGVYVQGRYEVQVLDSYGLKSRNNDCGGIYSVAAPRVNACKAPTVWQSYDIIFEAPTCENGKKVTNAIMTVYHNNVLIHDKVNIKKNNTTAGLGGDPCTPGPIMLQDHGNPVQYRNIWIQAMD